MDFELINPKEHKPKEHKQLFLDNHVIESMKGVKKSLHQPQKWGPVIKSGYQSQISPQWNTEKKIWEWWYMGENVHYTILHPLMENIGKNCLWDSMNGTVLKTII